MLLRLRLRLPSDSAFEHPFTLDTIVRANPSGSLVWPSPPEPPTIRFLARIPGPDAPTDRKSLANPAAADLEAGYTSSSMIQCSDCHSSDNRAVRGPHGSRYEPILEREYQQQDVEQLTSAINEKIFQEISRELRRSASYDDGKKILEILSTLLDLS